MSTYSVRSGDTLTALAKKFDTSVDALAKTNHIKNPDLIKTGQKLSVPGGHKAGHAASNKPKDGFESHPSVGGSQASHPGDATEFSTKSAAKSLKGLSLPSGDLEKGAKGKGVEQLQHALVKGGYMTQAQMNTGPGVFGPKTEAALKKFQHAHGVPDTGNYGPLTRKAFEKLGAKVGSASHSGGTGGSGHTGGTGGSAPVHTKPPTDSGGKGSVSLGDLRKIMPQLSEAKAKQYLPYLNSAMKEAGITTPKRQAAFLAQLAEESGQFRWMEELGSGKEYEGRKDLGNTHPGDGPRFKGRGPIQLTGRSNYIAAGKALGLDLVDHPSRAADPDVGFRTAAWFWTTHGLNKLADQGNFREITHRINGGYNGESVREAYYHKALQVLG